MAAQSSGEQRSFLATLNALAISTACTSARPTNTPWYWCWSISVPETNGAITWPMSRPDYTTPYTRPVELIWMARLTIKSRDHTAGMHKRTTVQVFDVQLTELQRQLSTLLGVPP